MSTSETQSNYREIINPAFKPIVAIIGRQNVGKSTLLNRVAGKRLAIVEDLPGTTRDRLFADVSWNGIDFTLVDTGGIEFKDESHIAKGVRNQAESAIAEADLILFLGDVKDGIVALDLEIADLLRRTDKPVVLAVNKVDSTKLEAEAAEFNQLGFGEPLYISGYHGRGIAELLDKIVSLLKVPEIAPEADTAGMLKIAILGRPNVGKSLLLNTMLGQERAIVDDTPGTTRDAIDTILDFKGQNVLIIDTAGIRRRGKVDAGIEWYSVLRSFQAIARADVVLLVLEATEPATAQDTHIVGYVRQAEKGIIIILNKWDLINGGNKAEYTEHIHSRLKFVPYAPILFVSAKTGQGVNKIMPLALRINQERGRWIAPEAIDTVLQEAISAHAPPHSGTRQLVISSASQTGINPPSFAFNVNKSELVHFSYRRYLENQLRQSFGFAGTPIRLVFKSRG
jgi:GTPase